VKTEISVKLLQDYSMEHYETFIPFIFSLWFIFRSLYAAEIIPLWFSVYKQTQTWSFSPNTVWYCAICMLHEKSSQYSVFQYTYFYSLCNFYGLWQKPCGFS